VRTHKLLMAGQSVVILALAVEVVLLTIQNRRLARSLEGSLQPLPRVGMAVQELELYELAGKRVQLTSAHGATLLLLFAPGCPACELDAAQWQKLAALCAERGVSLVAVCLDRRKECGEFAQRHHVPFPVVADSARAVEEVLGPVARIPARVLVKNGVIEEVMAGAGTPAREAEFEERLLRHMAL